MGYRPSHLEDVVLGPWACFWSSAICRREETERGAGDVRATKRPGEYLGHS